MLSFSDPGPPPPGVVPGYGAPAPAPPGPQSYGQPAQQNYSMHSQTPQHVPQSQPPPGRVMILKGHYAVWPLYCWDIIL